MWRERDREREGEGGGGLKGSAHFALQILVGPSLSEASFRRSTSPLSWYIDRPSDFRSRSLNRCLAASCFVVSAHSVRWIDAHDHDDACCRPKVCLCEFQKQIGTGQSRCPTAFVICFQHKKSTLTRRLWILPSPFQFLGWDIQICREHSRTMSWYITQPVTGEWVVQRLRGILETQSSGMKRTVEWKRLREEGNPNKSDSRVRSGKSNADAKDMFLPSGACMFQSGLRSVASLSYSSRSPCLPNSTFTTRLFCALICTLATTMQLYTQN